MKAGRRPTVILDRDGTIVEDRHYLRDPAALQFTPHAEAGLRRMRELGCRIIVITNQSGVGRGLMSPFDVLAVNSALRNMVVSAGSDIDAVYFCPHLPQDGCACRKPGLELLKQAAREWQFDIDDCVVIGDKSSDVQLGKNAGAVTMLLGSEHSIDVEVQPDYFVTSLAQAAEIIAQIESGAPATSAVRGAA